MSIYTKEASEILIKQSHQDLIPFSFIIDDIGNDSSALSFGIDISNGDLFNYSYLVGNVDSQTYTNEDYSTYVPVDKDGFFDHNSSFHVEIFAKDSSGVKDYSVRTEENLYNYETPSYVFNAPKFTWGYDVDEEQDFDPNSSGVWVGTSDRKLCRIAYDSNSASIGHTSNVASTPHTIIFEEDKSRAYLTAYDHLINLEIDNYGNVGNVISHIYETVATSNENSDVLVLAENSKVWSVQPYYGKVISRLPATLGVKNEYTGFDAPYEMFWSEYHQFYFVVGRDILWKFNDGNSTSIYKVDGYEIVDFDISPNGYVCMLLEGNKNSIIRILHPDLYRFFSNKYIEGETVKYCQYCDQGIFYVLVEYNDGGYSFKNYLFFTKENEVKVIDSSVSVIEPPLSETLAPLTKKIIVDYPNGGETLQSGEETEITWRSTESIDDSVKVEVYKGGALYEILSSSTSNNGVYKWNIDEDFENGIDYKIKVTWIGTTLLEDNFDESDDNFVVTNLPIEPSIKSIGSTIESVGIDFNSTRRHIVNVLSNGMIGFFDLDDMKFYGVFETNLEPTCMATREYEVEKFSDIDAVRVFVGSAEHLSDKWDSGIIETTKKSIYYGGGNNLKPGNKYHVNIQVHDKLHGWSGIQTKEFTMPR